MVQYKFTDVSETLADFSSGRSHLYTSRRENLKSHKFSSSFISVGKLQGRLRVCVPFSVSHQSVLNQIQVAVHHWWPVRICCLSQHFIFIMFILRLLTPERHGDHVYHSHWTMSNNIVTRVAPTTCSFFAWRSGDVPVICFKHVSHSENCMMVVMTSALLKMKLVKEGRRWRMTSGAVRVRTCCCSHLTASFVVTERLQHRTLLPVTTLPEVNGTALLALLRCEFWAVFTYLGSAVLVTTLCGLFVTLKHAVWLRLLRSSVGNKQMYLMRGREIGGVKTVR
jgi:hypothetical protein